MRFHSPHAALRRTLQRILVFGPLGLGALLAPLSGCGYHAAGSATHIPANVRTIAVPVFATHTQAYHTEMAFTQAVVRELDTRTRYRVLHHRLAPTPTPSSGNHPHSNLRPAHLRLHLRRDLKLPRHHHREGRAHRARRPRPLPERRARLREQYQSTQDLSGFIREDPAAVNRLARDFAQALVADMLESF